ncbi:MAG: hypothetical protein ABR497_11340, partial [Kiritimatiellia bacterium]
MNRITGWFFAVSLLCNLLLPLAYGAESFQLQVNDVSGLDEPWPLIGGLPFPEGELDDASRIRVVDGDGKEVPAQIDVAATWRDGSIRWALAVLTASPQGAYRVEYGPDVSRATPAYPLTVQQTDDGAITVDTGAAVYEFLSDRLLPETARMGDTVFLSNAGDGAYLVDNQGRLARVAGELSGIETEILKQGPLRTVIRREGWYVTADGARVARAKVWFYFSAGVPYVKVTHSLIFTEDTNKLWVRDYGLEFRTPAAPKEAVFALSEATWADRYIYKGPPEDKEKCRDLAEMFSSGLVEREQTLFKVALDGGEAYMLQEDYPHILDRKFQAVVARSPSPLITDEGVIDADNFWVHYWLKETEVAGDWAAARYNNHALTVVTPQLAQRFPKEIAIGPSGARVAFWSGRSGRELDFRAVTLVNEYWKGWADNAIHAFRDFHTGRLPSRGTAIGTRVAQQPSNAQGAARTHDVWLLPRAGNMDEQRLKARGLAAAHPPLLQADPAWLCASATVGWPMHPKDTERFSEVEVKISDYWSETLGSSYGHATLRRTGFIMWGKNVTLGHHNRWFRLSRAIQYQLDYHGWQLYMRSGERRYYDYGRHFTRFVGDLCYHHWNAGNRFRGGFVDANGHMPFYWHGKSNLGSVFVSFGWLMEYYLTGDEYANELLLMVGDAYRENWDDQQHLAVGPWNHLYNLAVLHTHNPDEAFSNIMQRIASMLIDLDNPAGLNDSYHRGMYYKTGTIWLFPLYFYYNATGDETAREAILRMMDDKFRFFYSNNQTYRLFLFAEVYRWTGNPAYLRLINLMVEQPFFGLMGHNFFQGAPAALRALDAAEQPIEPFPVLAATRIKDGDNKLEMSVLRNDFTGVGIMEHEFIEADSLPSILVRKEEDKPVNLSIFVRVSDEMDENTEPDAVVAHHKPNGEGAKVDNVRIVKQQRFKTTNPGRWYPCRWHFQLTLPADLPA